LGRPKKEKPNHGKYFEVKKTIGHKMNGDPIRKSFYSETSRSDADKQGKDWIVAQKVAEQAGEAFIGKEYTFSEWAKKWLEIYKKPNVDINTYKLSYEQSVNNHLIPFFGKAKMNNIQEINVKEFFDLKSFLSESVLKKLHMCLWGIFESGIENDICRKNPVKRVHVKSKRAKNVKHVYSETQIQKVKELAKNKIPEAYMILCSGVRRGEVLGFKWTDFHKDKKYISVSRALADIQDKAHRDDPENAAHGIKENPPKWNSFRDIPLSDECVAFIDGLPKNGEYIFPQKSGKPQSPNTWSGKLKRFMVEIHSNNPDIPILSPHELRHTFGTSLRRHGVDIYTIQKVMGHKSVEMTANIYVKNELDSLRRGLKLGASVVQVSYRRKYRAKRNKKEATQDTK
jgi:integrase